MDQNPPKPARPPVNLRIKFRSESVEQFIERYAVDVSRGGIFIRTREPLAVGTHLKLDFQFQNGSPLMAGDGTVVWIRELDPNRPTVPPGMGVRFDKLTAESQAVLEQLLAEKAKRERGGVPGSQVGGGMAVRRPSNPFPPLEPPTIVATPGELPPPDAPPAPMGPLAAVTSQVDTLAKPLAQKPDASSYRPIGAARNPFSSAADASSTSAPAQPYDSAAPTGDINDGPTQIAGRLPSFLLSDNEPTAVAAASTGQPASGTAEKSPVASSPRPISRPALPGMGGGAFAGRKPSSAPSTVSSPSGAAPADASAGGVVPVTSDASGSTRVADSSSGGATLASAESAAEAVAASSTGTATGTATPETDSAADAAMPPSPTPGTEASKETNRKAASERRRTPATMIAVSVVVLGVAAVFLVRFFSSQSTETAPQTRSGTPTVSGPAAPEPAAPPPAAPAAPEPTTVPVPAPAVAVAPGPEGTAVNATPGSPAPDQAAAPGAPAVENNAAAAAVAAPAPAESGTPGAATASTGSVAHKIPKRKPARAATRDPSGEVGTAAGVVAPAGTTTAATTPEGVSAATTTTTRGDEQAAAPVAEALTPVHELRVTSKPDGAELTLDGQTVGRTPFTASIGDVSTPHVVGLRKEGFEPFEQMISSASLWSKSKVTKGKPPLQVLKISARLRPVAGGADNKPGGVEAVPAAADTAAKAAAPPAEERPAAPAAGPAPAESPP